MCPRSVLSGNRKITKYDKECAGRLREIYSAQKKADGLTYEKLAKKCGWSTATVGFYMKADLALNYKAIRTLAKALNVGITAISPKLKGDDVSEQAAEFEQLIAKLSNKDKKLALSILMRLVS